MSASASTIADIRLAHTGCPTGVVPARMGRLGQGALFRADDERQEQGADGPGLRGLGHLLNGGDQRCPGALQGGKFQLVRRISW